MKVGFDGFSQAQKGSGTKNNLRMNSVALVLLFQSPAPARKNGKTPAQKYLDNDQASGYFL
jgi:hypothetical protein